MSVLVGVGDVITAAIALVELRDRGVPETEVVMLVGDMDAGSESRPDPRTVPEMAALLSRVRRVEALNALIWPQVPQGWRASDLAVDGVGRLLVELEDTLEEVIVADDHPAWEILARASRAARVTRLSVGRGGSTPVSVPEVAALIAPQRSARPAAKAAVWVPNGSKLLERDVADLSALLTVAARYGQPFDVLIRDLPPLPHGWFDEHGEGELLQGANLVSDDVGPEVALLRHPVETLVTNDTGLAARAVVLGVPQVRLVDRDGQDSRYDMMVPPTGTPGDSSEGRNAVQDDEPRDSTAPRRATRQLRLSRRSVGLAIGVLVLGVVAVALADSLLGGGAAVATAALLLGSLGIALAAAVVWEIRAHGREVRAGHRQLKSDLHDLQKDLSDLQAHLRDLPRRVSDLGTSLHEVGEQQAGLCAQLAEIEQRGIVISAMQERALVAGEDIARAAALLAARAETVADRTDDG